MKNLHLSRLIEWSIRAFVCCGDGAGDVAAAKTRVSGGMVLYG